MGVDGVLTDPQVTCGFGLRARRTHLRDHPEFGWRHGRAKRRDGRWIAHLCPVATEASNSAPVTIVIVSFVRIATLFT